MRPVYYLGVFIPVAVALELAHASPVLVFTAAALGVIPTAALMGTATEEIAERTGPGIGGFLNVTFGNAPELIIAFFALREGLHEVVKASIVGSIIGNVLLVLGAAMLVGGWNRDKQTFNRTAANAQSAMLLLALAALILPAIVPADPRRQSARRRRGAPPFGSEVEDLSMGVAIILMLSYMLRAALLDEDPPQRSSTRTRRSTRSEGGWSVRKATVMLAIAAVLRGRHVRDPRRLDLGGLGGHRPVRVLRRRVRRGDRRQRRRALGRGARGPKDKMDLAVNIAIGSSAQIALFVAPVLVLLSYVVGPGPMPLVFNGYELGAMLFAVLIANFLTQEGESNWFEGVQLLSLYAVLGLVFYLA